jgi:hypothetical protein
MDEFYIGAMVDTQDGIGEIIDSEEMEGDSPHYIVRLERGGEEIEYREFELTLLDEYDGSLNEIDDDEDLDIDRYAVEDEDLAEFDREFDEEDAE